MKLKLERALLALPVRVHVADPDGSIPFTSSISSCVCSIDKARISERKNIREPGGGDDQGEDDAVQGNQECKGSEVKPAVGAEKGGGRGVGVRLKEGGVGARGGS